MWLNFFLVVFGFLAEVLASGAVLYIALWCVEKWADRVDAWWRVKEVESFRRKGRWC